MKLPSSPCKGAVVATIQKLRFPRFFGPFAPLQGGDKFSSWSFPRPKGQSFVLARF
jgi:hypothetical protein